MARATLYEFGPDYVGDTQGSPYMERTLRFRNDVVEKIPGLVYVDQTGRLQSVKKEWNVILAK